MTERRAMAARYPIRAVSKLTGLGIDTLRAWERRHAAVTPSRDDRGRMYTDADVARLRLLSAVVEDGHSIGRVAGLSDRELRRLAGPGTPVAAPPMPSPAAPTERLTAAIAALDAVAIDRELSRLAVSLTPLALVRDAIMPAVARTGDDWHAGRAGIAQEHLITATVRSLLGSFLRLHAEPEAATRLLFATPAGERHELGTLGAALIAAASGLGVTYIGADLPAADIVGSVGPTRAHVLVLGLTRPTASPATATAVRAIARGLPSDVELWAGGRGAQRLSTVIAPRGLVFADYTAFHEELVRLGGRAA